MPIIFENGQYFESYGGQKKPLGTQPLQKTDPNAPFFVPPQYVQPQRQSTAVGSTPQQSQSVPLGPQGVPLTTPQGASGIPTSVINPVTGLPNTTIAPTTPRGVSGIQPPSYVNGVLQRHPDDPLYVPPTPQLGPQGVPTDIPQGASGIPSSVIDPTTGRAPVQAPIVPTPTVPTTQAPTPAVPAVPTAQAQPDYQQLFDLFGQMFGGIGQQAPGLQEDFGPSTAPSALNQALTDRTLQALNRPYGYTPEEEALIYQNRLADFNLGTEDDLHRLETLYEAYGLSSGAGELGGQAGSSLQDYFGKRAQAQRGLAGDLTETFLDKRTQDEQNAISNAAAVSQMVNNQDRGSFQDYLSLMDFTLREDSQSFNQTMQAAGFWSEEDQRAIMNQMGYEQADIDNYFRTKQLEIGTALDFQSLLEQTQGLSPADALTALSFAQSGEQNLLGGLAETPEGMMLPMLLMSLMGIGGLGGGDVSGGGVDIPGVDLPGVDVPGIDIDIPDIEGGGKWKVPSWIPDLGKGLLTWGALGKAWKWIKNLGGTPPPVPGMPEMLQTGSAWAWTGPVAMGVAAGLAVYNEKKTQGITRRASSAREENMGDVLENASTWLYAGNAYMGQSPDELTSTIEAFIADAYTGNPNALVESGSALDAYSLMAGLTQLGNMTEDQGMNLNPDYPGTISVRDITVLGKQDPEYIRLAALDEQAGRYAPGV